MDAKPSTHEQIGVSCMELTRAQELIRRLMDKCL